jgi:hypothetical protein
MDDEMLGELMAVVGTFNQTNRLADGYQVEVDSQLIAATENGGKQVGGSEGRRIRERSWGANRKPGRAFRSRSRASAG